MFGRKRDKQPGNGGNLTGNLGDEKQRFRIIINNIDDGVILIDNQQVIQLINPSAAGRCGWPEAEATGLNVRTVIKLVNDKGEDITEGQNLFNRIFKVNETLRDNKAFLVNRANK